MDGPVIQEMAVSDGWRRRRIRLWTAATGAVGGIGAVLGANAWQAPMTVSGESAVAVAVAVGAAALIHRGWRRWFRRADVDVTIWRDALPTPHGERPGQVLRRPTWLSSKDGLSVRFLAIVGAVPLAASHAAMGNWYLAIPVGAAAGWGMARLTHRITRLIAGVALTRKGVVTVDEMINWDEINKQRWSTGGAYEAWWSRWATGRSCCRAVTTE